MADAQDTYVALPDGSYVQVPHDATPDQLSALRQKLGGQQPLDITNPEQMTAHGPAAKAPLPESNVPKMNAGVEAVEKMRPIVPGQLVPPAQTKEEALTNAGALGAGVSIAAPFMLPEGRIPAAITGSGEGYEAGKRIGGAVGFPRAGGALGAIAGGTYGLATGKDPGVSLLKRSLGIVSKEAPVAEKAIESVVEDAGEGRPATWTNERVVELAKEGNRNAIAQANARGIRIPYVSEGSLPAKGSLGKIILTDRD